MRSIREIYVIGHGPSSSHTMGPAKAADYIKDNYKEIKKLKITLYGSLARTGKGHLTDYILDLKFKDVPHEIIFDVKTKTKHPNTILFEITNSNGEVKNEKILSIGGGTIVTKDNYNDVGQEVYPHSTMTDILNYCDKEHLTLEEYVLKYEGEDILEYIKKCYICMNEARDRGLKAEGYLPGPLKVQRKAKEMYENFKKDPNPRVNYDYLMATTAFAVSEENASGGLICIAPTCGSCGVVPAVLSYLEIRGNTEEEIIRAMLVGGLFGIICKTNASVSGAEAGCQAEIGVACSMAAAIIASAKKFENHKIAQAAEIALEHSLGLTCDPVGGYVQIPCIERNALYAAKAKSAVYLASIIPGESSKISYDDSVRTMYETGLDLQSGYRETSEKGLASLYKEKE